MNLNMGISKLLSTKQNSHSSLHLPHSFNGNTIHSLDQAKCPGSYTLFLFFHIHSITHSQHCCLLCFENTPQSRQPPNSPNTALLVSGIDKCGELPAGVPASLQQTVRNTAGTRSA